MKKIIYSAIFGALVAMSLASCEGDTSAGLTSITYYPVIELNGGDVAINLGETFVDPGAVATLNGEDVSSTMTVTHNINNNQVGLYHVNYAAVNDEGFSAAESRNVFVINEGNIATIYKGESQYGTRHYTNLPIIIEDNGDGTYTVEDILGGFYCMGRYPGYEEAGYDFWAEAIIQIEGTQVELLEVGSWYFDSDPITLTEGTFDEATGTITLNLDFAGDPFFVQLVAVSK